ncbi:HEPN domain-containing protein [Streptomyces collinus]|uniref:HEPN domain-containing protein n=1 Tax=Streptomyces collinus TaxID=42684 RepID=UPI0037F68AF6
MGAPPKMSARDAFNLNMQDAEMLVELAKLLSNQRARRMRRELRERLGSALALPRKHWDDLECLENERVFVTFKPGYADWRDRLHEPNLRPLLRQALVAACAAVETFCADRVMELYPVAIRQDPPPSRLLELSLTVEDYLAIEKKYKKKAWGLRQVVELEVRQRASPAPAQIGTLFALVGKNRLFPEIDKIRKVAKKVSTAQLDRIVERRNLIAHTGDRSGRGRAPISVEEVEADLNVIAEIIEALDQLTKV